LFSLFLLGLAIWGIVIFSMRASPDITKALYWESWLPPLGMFTSVFLFHFAVRYNNTTIKGWVIPSLYLFCLAYIPLVATDLLFRSMQVKSYGYAPVFGPVAPVHIVFSYVLTIMALVIFIRKYQTSTSGEEKNRSLYIVTGITTSVVLGFFDILPILGLPLYPGFIVGNIIFCFLATTAIMRHNLLDIHILFRKGAAYALMSTIVATPFIGIFILFTEVFRGKSFQTWGYIGLGVVLAFVLPQLWQRTQRWVDRWFYRDRYDYLKALEAFSRQNQSVIDSARLGSTMVDLVAKALRSSSVYLLQPIPRSRDFAISFSSSVNFPTPVTSFKRSGALMRWLERSNNMLSYEDIEIIPQLHSLTPQEKHSLEQIGAGLIVPLKAPTGQLPGVLILGKKLSEQPYTIEDKQLISTLSNHIATSLENARLYDDAFRARQNLETWLNGMTDPVMIINMDRSIQFTNKAAREKLGLTSSSVCWEALGKNAECPNCPVKLYLGGSREGYRFVRNVGAREYDVAVAPLLNPDGSTSIIAVYRDVTERKRAEEKERQLQQELYRASRLASIGELAAGVAHEVNNPLTGVVGFAQRLLRKSSDDEARHGLEIIYNEALRAAKIVHNLLTFARRREAKKQNSDINDILLSALELRSYELSNSNIEVTTDLTTNLPKAMVDFQQIQEVFLNIILNAEQAMTEAHGAGKLIVRTEAIDNAIRVSFNDDGPGISPEHLDKLFDPFFTTREERGGTGLGLSVCHGIVSEHGGKIYAQSNSGAGATFVVELPRR